MMQSGKFYVGNPVYSVTEGRRLGTAKDLYVDAGLTTVVGVYLGSEGLFSRKEQCIERTNVVVFGVDAILVTQDDVVVDGVPACEAETWLRRDRLPGRPITTAGGTQVGTVEDIMVDEEMRIVGIQLDRVWVEGPVSENRAITREAITDVGDEGAMIIDLNVAERQEMKSV